MGFVYIPKNRPPKPPKTFALCRLCKAKIFWTATKSMKNMPVDYDPKIEYLFDGIAKPYFEPKIMKTHWASCPHAHKLRKD